VPPNPLSPYAAAKAACELYLSAYTGMYDLAPVCLALANVYGPRQDPHGEAGVVAIFGGAMLAGRPTAIYGTGNAARDYVYVGDVVEAFVRAALAPLTLNGMFNIGTGIQTTTAELHRMMSEIIGVRAEPRFADARTGEIQAIALDSSAAASAFGWAPKVGIREGIWRTISWMQEAIDSSCPQRPECRALSDESHCRADPRGSARLNPTAARP
jgi:UDP-glucose 4-epimerase